MVQYRKTRQGEWVVFGLATEVRAAAAIVVTKKDGSTKVEVVERVGRTFEVDGQECVYGYIARSQGGGGGRRQCGEWHTGRCCPTDGNCSSAGNGRSCGAYCCDGW